MESGQRRSAGPALLSGCPGRRRCAAWAGGWLVNRGWMKALSIHAARAWLIAKECRLRLLRKGLICAPQQSGFPPAAFLDVSSLNSAAPSGAALFFGGASRDSASPALGFPFRDGLMKFPG